MPMNEKKTTFLYAHLDDACKYLYKPVFFDFFTMAEQAGIEDFLKNRKVSHLFFGGFEDCERKMLCLYPDDADPDELIWPMGALRFPRNFKFDHRHVLGTLMSLGITRESLGDISLSEDEVQVIFKAHLASFLEREFVNLRGKTIKPAFFDACDIRAFPRAFKTLGITVNSERVDSVIARIWGLSRQDAALAVKQGRVRINDAEVGKLTVKVKPGDVIALRGHGKAVIEGFDGNTKKSRLRLTIKKYV